MTDTLVVFSARARRDLRRIDPRTRTRIVAGIEQYAETGAGDVKRLQTRTGLRLRVGDWRVFFTQPDKGVVEIDAILHRREAYRRS
ncbi:MAG: type II toxin-antitoxin system RelE/ParE family toxin [Acidobacteriia bacterium]|nr:type II toxin-antitoxin system RelE/ParE family toxin [Terriglobia bacterium]